MGGKNPSRRQGKFLGAKKSLSTERKYQAKEAVTWTLTLKKLEKPVQEKALNYLKQKYIIMNISTKKKKA